MKKIIIPAAMIAAMTLAMSSCVGGKNTDTSIAVEKEDTINVTVEPVRMQEVDQLVSFTATVEAEVVNKIAPQAPVRIRKINVEVGDRVSKGQTLVVLDNNNLTQIKAQLDNMEIEFSRVEELYKAGGVSKSQYDQTKTQLDVMKASYANLEENTRLVSPVNGIVSARNYDNGDLYAGNPVVVVEQISPVKILLDVNESYYKNVAKGMPIENITLDAFPGEKFDGKVSIVYPTIDPSTRTFKMEVKIANANQKARPGMFSRVTLNFGSASRTIVSDVAIQKQIGSGERFVYVLTHDKKHVTRRVIELGRRLEGNLASYYECLHGLDNDDIVVLSGQSLLAEGRPINIIDKGVER